jgi:hypothetical protein
MIGEEKLIFTNEVFEFSSWIWSLSEIEVLKQMVKEETCVYNSIRDGWRVAYHIIYNRM